MKIEPLYQFQKGMIAHFLKESEVISMYIDYVNNYLTVKKFAEDKGFTTKVAEHIINIGRTLNDDLAEKRKQV